MSWNYKDLTNQQFGSWQVIERDDEYGLQFSHGEVYWKCKCLKCGNLYPVRSSALTSGASTQCAVCSRASRGKDEIGKVYNRLIVLERRPSKKHRIMWLCRCECGNYIEVSGTDLRMNKVQSCGHCPTRVSNGEHQVAMLLSKNNIEYKTEYIFSDFTYITGQHPRFDFAIFKEGKLSYLIEIDGRQHFSYCNSIWNTKENYEKTIARDKIKNEYCLQHNIPLIRIPYHRLPKLIIEDLLINSKYRLKETERSE